MSSPREPSTILLVEDDEDTREDLAAVLREEGYDVVTARDGIDALERLEYGTRPSVIVLDLMMPRMDGFQFRREQLSRPALAGIPIAVLSGARQLDEQVAGLSAAATISKPVSLDKLLAALAPLCRPPSRDEQRLEHREL